MWAAPASAAVVALGPLSTSYSDFSPPWTNHIEASASVNADLSDLGGLTPGADMRITFSTADPLFWTGLWEADTGSVTLSYSATLTLAVGSQSVSASPPWAPFGPVDFDGAFSPVAGFEMGPVPDSFTLTVPWGTDLTHVTLTLTDRFALTGPNAGIELSGLSLDSFTLTTTSAVPEPGTGLLMIVSAAVMLSRRRVARRLNSLPIRTDHQSTNRSPDSLPAN